MRGGLVATLVVLAPACGATRLPAQRPADFSIRVESSGGMMPTSSSMRCDAAGCAWSSMNAGVTVPEQRRPATAAQLDALYKVVHDQAFDRIRLATHPVIYDGGGLAVHVTAAGQTYDIGNSATESIADADQARYGAVIAAVQALVDSLGGGSAEPSASTAPASSSAAPAASRAAPLSSAAAGFAASVGNAPFVLRNDDRSYPIRFGRVYVHEGSLFVSLASDADPGCEWPGKYNEAFFHFAVPPGPAGRFFVDAPFGHLATGGVHGGTVSGLGAQGDAFLLDPFDPTPGSHVRGRIRTLSSGSGAFDATVCPGVSIGSLRPLPADAPAHAFSGTVGTATFTALSGVAVLSRHSGTYQELSYVDLFGSPGVGCKDHDAASADRTRITDIGGSSTEVNLAGTPQPASAGIRFASDKTGPGRILDTSAVWVRFKKLSFQPGDVLEGVAVMAADASKSGDKVDLGGSFQVTVCEH